MDDLCAGLKEAARRTVQGLYELARSRLEAQRAELEQRAAACPLRDEHHSEGRGQVYRTENFFGDKGDWRCSECGITYEGTKPLKFSEKAERALNRYCCEIPGA